MLTERIRVYSDPHNNYTGQSIDKNFVREKVQESELLHEFSAQMADLIFSVVM